ncbi:MAG: polysaccharide deacetylase family protein [Bacteriovoracales bacterium]
MKVLLIIFLSLPAFAQKIISNVPNTQKKIALTFDACSTRRTPQYDKRITDILIKTRTPATIFLGGRWIEKEEPHVTDLAFNPLFELGNHSWDHPHLTQLTNKEIQEQLSKTQEALFKATGKMGRYFRPPYGEYDNRVLKIAGSLGLIGINYDFASGDPDSNMTKEKLIKWVVKKTRPGSIIIMHINKKGINTAEALPEIIFQLRKKGFRFVTISDLINSAYQK